MKKVIRLDLHPQHFVYGDEDGVITCKTCGKPVEVYNIAGDGTWYKGAGTADSSRNTYWVSQQNDMSVEARNTVKQAAKSPSSLTNNKKGDKNMGTVLKKGA